MTKNQFSSPVTFFRESRLPEKATLAGYSALIDAYELNVVLPRILLATGERHRKIRARGWLILTPRHAPQPSLPGHLGFALKHEGLDLAVLKRLFQATGPRPIEDLVRAQPTGTYARRIWFLYEWLLGQNLDLPDARAGRYVPVVDPDMQLAGQGRTSPRHKVRDNLPGTPDFCPMVHRTSILLELMGLDLQDRARDVIQEVPQDVLARSAAFLLLQDSKASYAIEGEGSSRDRIQRWARALGQAGSRPLDLEELIRLQEVVIGDFRFVRQGLRTEGGFVGEHDRHTGQPIPEHLSARPQDLPELIQGLLTFENGPGRELDPIVAAAALAFGFIYIHPFEDGNGRIHRYLIHHVLAERGFNPPAVVFPVSAVLLQRIEEYREVLRDYSARLLPAIQWEPTERGNVRILNDTADFYRYFDATPHAEFLYDCVRQTIERELPEETTFLRLYDEFRSRVESMLDMPEPTLNLLFRFLRQNQGCLSRRARTREFKDLTEDEARRIEAIYAELFG
ncbi:MAG: Fic family protein [Desulfohalobiaceae bacterium]